MRPEWTALGLWLLAACHDIDSLEARPGDAGCVDADCTGQVDIGSARGTDAGQARGVPNGPGAAVQSAGHAHLRSDRFDLDLTVATPTGAGKMSNASYTLRIEGGN